MNDTASPRQLAISSVLMLFSIKLITFPSIIFGELKTDALIMFILMLTIDLGVLFSVLYIKKQFPEMSCFQILEKFFGRVLTKIITLLLALFFFGKLLYLVVEGFSFLRDTLLEEANMILFLFCFIPVINALAHSNFRAFMRTSEFFFFSIVGALIICLFLSFVEIDNNMLSPLFDVDAGTFFKSLFQKLMWFGDYIYIFVLIDKIEKNKKNIKKTMLKYNIFAIILSGVFYFAYYRLFQTTSVVHTGAVLDIVQFSARIGNVGKIDIIPINVVMFAIFFQGAIYLLCTKKSLDNLYKKSTINSFIINILLCVLAIGFVTNINICVNIFTNYLSYLALFIAYILPIIVFILTLSVKRKKK